MKILFYEWNAYNLYDTRLTLEALGHEVIMLTRPLDNPEEDDAYTDWLMTLLRKEHYDFLFSINFFPVLAEACHSSGTLYVCWNCDSPLLALYHETVFYPENVIFTFDQSNCEEIKALGVTNIFHLPLAVNTDRLLAQLDFTRQPVYPVSFVGSLYEKNSYDRIAHRLPPYLCGYLEGTMNAQCLISGGNLLDKLLTEDICLMLEDIMEYHKSVRSFAGVRELFSSTVLGFKTASLERHHNLHQLSLYLKSHAADKEPLHLFTTDHAEDLPFVTVHGPIDYRTEMPQIFHDSYINLNMTIPNIRTGIPLRVWDVLGSGGFLLSNYQTEFDTVFKAGKMMDVFENEEELIDKTAFYLKQDTLRRKIARTGLELVTKEHNYTVRMAQLFSQLKAFL